MEPRETPQWEQSWRWWCAPKAEFTVSDWNSLWSRSCSSLYCTHRHRLCPLVCSPAGSFIFSHGLGCSLRWFCFVLHSHQGQLFLSLSKCGFLPYLCRHVDMLLGCSSMKTWKYFSPFFPSQTILCQLKFFISCLVASRPLWRWVGQGILSLPKAGQRDVKMTLEELQARHTYISHVSIQMLKMRELFLNLLMGFLTELKHSISHTHWRNLHQRLRHTLKWVVHLWWKSISYPAQVSTTN